MLTHHVCKHTQYVCVNRAACLPGNLRKPGYMMHLGEGPPLLVLKMASHG